MSKNVKYCTCDENCPIHGEPGTPRTFHEAIENAFGGSPYLGGLKASVHEHTRDYLAQKFGAAYLTHDEKTVEILEKLFNDIVGE